MRALALPVLWLTVSAAAQPASLDAAGSPPTNESAPARSAGAATDAWEALRALARAETPRSPAESLPLPPEFPRSVAEPIAAADAARARATLAEVSADLAERAFSADPSGPGENGPSEIGPSEDDRARVAEWRSLAAERLADGDASGAASLLMRAAELDPGATDLWVELGEARLAKREGAAAIRACAQAAQRGSAAPRAMLALGRAEALRRRFDDAAALYVRALRGPTELDADQQAPLYAELAAALRATGRLTAAAEADRAALDAVDRALAEGAAGAGISPDVLDLARRRAELWTRVGDASMRLGDTDAALDAYTRAARFPTLDPSSLERRRAYAAMRLGLPARAALDTLRAIERDGGRMDAARVRMLERLAKDRPVAEAALNVLDALERDVAGEAGFPVPPVAASGFARARAALSTPAEGERVLLDRMASAPEDADAARDLFARVDEPGRAADLLVRLVERAPFDALRYAERLIASPIESDRVRAALDARADGAIASAALSMSLADPRAAAERLRPVDPETLAPGARSLAARAAAEAGDWKRVSEILESLDADAGEAERRARADALRAAQRFEEALDTLAPLLDRAAPTPALIPVLIDGAELALGAREPERARVWLEQALIADPTDPRVHRALVRLYLPEGPLPDAQRLGEVIREIRRADPSGGLLRFLAARDLVTAGRLVRAERALLELAESGYEDTAVLDTLGEVWTRLAPLDTETYDRAEQWLRARIDSLPTGSALQTAHIATLARVLTQAERPEEADRLLAAALARRFDRTLSQLRESLLREVLGRPAEADTLAMRRLEAGPRGLDESFELAGLHASRGRWTDAVAELDRALPPDVALTRPQAAAAEQLLSTAMRAALSVSDDDNEAIAEIRTEIRAAADRLVTLLLERGQTLSPGTLAQHVGVMALRPERTVADLFDAAERAAEAHEDSATFQRVRASEFLREAGRTDDALALARRLAEAHPDDDELLFQRFRLAVLSSEPRRITGLLETALSDSDTARLAERLSVRGRDRADIPGLRTELLHRAAIEVFGLGDDPASRELYRRVLERDPNHGMAANNLGYALLEDGDLDAAEPLLERAAELEPESPNVLDSIGWLRYRQGRLRDAPGPDGAVVRGARTWLQIAAATPLGAQNEVLLDHLGDTHYRLGETDLARLRWEEADRMARDGLRTARQRSLVTEIDRLVELRANLARKLRALDEREPAPVAPIRGDANGADNNRPEANRDDGNPGDENPSDADAPGTERPQ